MTTTAYSIEIRISGKPFAASLPDMKTVAEAVESQLNKMGIVVLDVEYQVILSR